MVAVNPEILKWARSTAGLDLDTAAKKLGFKNSSKSSAKDKLISLENGDSEPSPSQLNRLSKAYYQPLLVFYLSEPPRPDDRGQDFRTLPQQTSDRKGNAHLNLLIRNVKAAQRLIKDLLEEEQTEPLPFIGSVTMSTGVDAVAHNISDTLKFDLRAFREKRSIHEAFAYLRHRIESNGIFVLLLSDLGSHHTTIPVEVFRGFAFADTLAPFIVINRQDARSAWSFTALHEIAHLWLGASGISGSIGELQIEKFCDLIAGMILLPPQDLSELASLQYVSFEDAVRLITDFANSRNVSRAMVAYNLLSKKMIETLFWQKLQYQFDEDRKAQAAKEKDKQRSQGSGPSYYAVRRHQLGPGLVQLAKQFVDTGQLTPSKAGVVLGVKPLNVFPLLNPKIAKARS